MAEAAVALRNACLAFQTITTPLEPAAATTVESESPSICGKLHATSVITTVEVDDAIFCGELGF